MTPTVELPFLIPLRTVYTPFPRAPLLRPCQDVPLHTPACTCHFNVSFKRCAWNRQYSGSSRKPLRLTHLSPTLWRRTLCPHGATQRTLPAAQFSKHRHRSLTARALPLVLPRASISLEQVTLPFLHHKTVYSKQGFHPEFLCYHDVLACQVKHE